MNTFAPETCHAALLDTAPRVLAFDPHHDFAAWRQAVDTKLRELVGVMPAPTPPAVRIEFDTDHGDFRERRFVFTAEAGADVPCHLWTPPGKGPFPVVICLQGHSTGMHVTLGRPQFPHDAHDIAGGRDYAPQVVRQGFAALTLEQRCFGEREDQRPKEARFFDNRCHHASMTALLLGRTMIGERVWDIARAIDVLEDFAEIDATRVACLGNSGGGTTTYYAACLEPRIGIAIPSCAVCSFRSSIGRIDHCHDNYLPQALRFFEMGDLAGLIAPRILMVVAGREDSIFPIDGVAESFAVIQEIYAAAGVPDRCRLLVGEGGHRPYPDLIWPAFREMAGW